MSECLSHLEAVVDGRKWGNSVEKGGDTILFLTEAIRNILKKLDCIWSAQPGQRNGRFEWSQLIKVRSAPSAFC